MKLAKEAGISPGTLAEVVGKVMVVKDFGIYALF